MKKRKKGNAFPCKRLDKVEKKMIKQKVLEREALNHAYYIAKFNVQCEWKRKNTSEHARQACSDA